MRDDSCNTVLRDVFRCQRVSVESVFKRRRMRQLTRDVQLRLFAVIFRSETVTVGKISSP